MSVPVFTQGASVIIEDFLNTLEPAFLKGLFQYCYNLYLDFFHVAFQERDFDIKRLKI